ncbi:PTS sugar transporter subunit IIA [Paenibacillus sp. UNC451MF]|uniref:PTS sugar transporter subunit IIA n=1 Tax=Paenibacillus sp. UNC451MF TaxID=1449063 RepID=UPI00048F0013|nr:PTS glucose transporter subunit IIA [Paenibacillus sp. UNC451MF]
MFTHWLTNKTKYQSLDINSPLTGQSVPLDQVPDKAFASKQMGEGVAIKPTDGVLIAPFDGVVVYLIQSKHALILEHESGIQLLIHIGINTVALKGEGFHSHIVSGEMVSAGQKLITFDVDFIREAGYEPITPIVIANGELAPDITCSYKSVQAGEHAIMRVIWQTSL